MSSNGYRSSRIAMSANLGGFPESTPPKASKFWNDFSSSSSAYDDTTTISASSSSLSSAVSNSPTTSEMLKWKYPNKPSFIVDLGNPQPTWDCPEVDPPRRQLKDRQQQDKQHDSVVRGTEVCESKTKDAKPDCHEKTEIFFPVNSPLNQQNKASKGMSKVEACCHRVKPYVPKLSREFFVCLVAFFMLFIIIVLQSITLVEQKSIKTTLIESESNLNKIALGLYDTALRLNKTAHDLYETALGLNKTAEAVQGLPSLEMMAVP